jgi:hypothetical protein
LLAKRIVDNDRGFNSSQVVDWSDGPHDPGECAASLGYSDFKALRQVTPGQWRFCRLNLIFVNLRVIPDMWRSFEENKDIGLILIISASSCEGIIGGFATECMWKSE